MKARSTCTIALLLAIAGAALAPSNDAGAADWRPSEKLFLVTHTGPGSGIDVFLRRTIEAWEKSQLISVRAAIDNVTGAGGDRARRQVAVASKANPHVLLGFTPQLIVAPLRARSDVTVKSFTPVAILLVEPMILYVNAEMPWKSLDDLIGAARAKPKSIIQGGGGYGAPPSIAGRDLAAEAGTQFIYTPFKSSADAIVALLGKHIHFVLEQPSEAHQHVAAGKLRALAVVYPSALYPDVPTFTALGYKFRVLKQFRGVVAPPGIAPEVVRYYAELLDRTRGTPTFKDYVKQNELVEDWIAGEKLTQFIDSEEQIYRKIIQDMETAKRGK